MCNIEQPAFLTSGSQRFRDEKPAIPVPRASSEAPISVLVSETKSNAIDNYGPINLRLKSAFHLELLDKLKFTCDRKIICSWTVAEL